MAYRIGKHTGVNGRLQHAFDIESNGAGGIRINNISELGEPERTLIFAHFGRDCRSRVNHSSGQHIRLFKAGDKGHFKQAVYQIPAPFGVMS
jgi:hypothetical protein